MLMSIFLGALSTAKAQLCAFQVSFVAFALLKTALLAVTLHKFLDSLKASASVVHNGVIFPALSFCQPYSEGLGKEGFAIRTCPQI